MATAFARLKPLQPNNTVPIVFAVNDCFVPYMTVMAESIVQHAREGRLYDIIVLHSGLSEESVALLQTVGRGTDNISVRLVDVKPLVEGIKLYVDCDGNRLTGETYYRLLLPDILADEYEKVIYADGDMICLTDISPLMDVDLTGFFLAAVRDYAGIAPLSISQSGMSGYRKRVVGCKHQENYFNAGLLVLNVKALREYYPDGKLWKLAQSYPWRQHDQDVLNRICAKEKALILPAKWNVLPDYGNYFRLNPQLKEEWTKGNAHAAIFHYAENYKPWKKDTPRQGFFWRMAAMSPALYMILEKMVPNGFQGTYDVFESVRTGLLSGTVKPEYSAIMSEMAAGILQNKREPKGFPLISVIIPIYNDELYLEKCLSSVCNQTYKNLEIIAVDDGSTDRSPVILADFKKRDARIKAYRKENGGVSSARNFGLKHATGDYIGWVDGDDWIAPDMYEYLWANAQSKHTPITICGHIFVKGSNLSGDALVSDEVITAPEALRRLLSYNIRVYLHDRLFEKSLFQGIEFKEGVVFEDVLTAHLLIQKAGWIGIAKWQKDYHVIREESLSHERSILKKTQRAMAIVKRYEDLYDAYPSLRELLFKDMAGALGDLRDILIPGTREEYGACQEAVETVSNAMRICYACTGRPHGMGRLTVAENWFLMKGTRFSLRLSKAVAHIKKAKEKITCFLG